MTDLAAALLRDVPTRYHFLNDPRTFLSHAEVLAALTRALDPALAEQVEALRAERDGLLTTWAESRERHLAAEAEVSALQAEIVTLKEREEKLRTLLEGWLELASHCDIAEGVCCCGESMNGHSNPMDCGHTPLDHGAYIAVQLGEETRAALTTEART